MAVPAAVGSTVATRMLYSSRSFEEVIYRDELDHLVSNTTHLEVVYTLTRVQPPGWKGYHRRIDTEMLREVAWPSDQHPLIFICGPTPFVETAAARRLISGYGDGSFRPNNFVTRAQVAKMSVIAHDWTLSGATVNLCDVSNGHWAWTYVQVAVQHGLFSGYGDSCFRPDQLATRAQLAKVLSVSMR